MRPYSPSPCELDDRAPDRGMSGRDSDETSLLSDSYSNRRSREDAETLLAERAEQGHHFTVRSVILGTLIGVVICFSNTYFGLQTGWVSSMAMPSALMGFAWFKAVSKHLAFPFTPIENVLVQTVAGSVGTMPLGCGFVGVIPALEFLLKPDETPDGSTGLHLSLWKLIVWALGLCFFGVVFAVPLRKQFIIREKLKFPSGTATALMIGVLHGGEKNTINDQGDGEHEGERAAEDEQRLMADAPDSTSDRQNTGELSQADLDASSIDDHADWRARIRLLTLSFGLSALYTVVSYFIPRLHDLPIFGMYIAESWLWTLNPSPAYVGQGIIMGPATTLHMLLGAVIGWGVLSPLAKAKHWAPGPVGDWETGSKGWIVWISLAIMLADSIISLGWLVLRPIITYGRLYLPRIIEGIRRGTLKQELRELANPKARGYRTVGLEGNGRTSPDYGAANTNPSKSKSGKDMPEPDAPPEHLIGWKVTVIGLILSLIVCMGAVHYTFAGLIPISLTVLALVLALILSIMGVRALGETDLNPVSGISKITQLVFALVTPQGAPNAVIINLIAGAISESGALQAGDLLQDLRTGHNLGASPKAQFYGQIIGSAIGAVISACVYKLYTNVYEVPGGMFQVPTGYVWAFTARLVTGQGLPPMVGEWATGAAIVFSVLTILRMYGNATDANWTPFIPGGIAVAVGMYNTPSFTFARTIGGLVSWYWKSWRKERETPIIILASGLILGEGLFSIVNLALASFHVPHL
ncbi:hypothetical protein AAFC00_004262 [Neodothiora populina]